MNYKVSISEQAEQDLNDIYSYIYYELKSNVSADRISLRLRSVMEGLSLMPKKFHLYPIEPWFSRGVRSVPVGNYMVFYLVNDADAEVLITRIAYGKRNMKKVLP